MAQTRITAGDLRGRAVLTPRGGALRPTSALVRQALFDIVGEGIAGASVVDLYCGSGAVGFEALSRGAGRVAFVDIDRRVLELVRATAERLGVSDRCRLAAVDAAAWVRRSAELISTADLVFADAPYRDDGVERALRLVAAHPPRLLVCEHHRARRTDDHLGPMRRVREATYGATRLTFWRREDEEAP